jgi:nucleoid-associated protein YgaU
MNQGGRILLLGSSVVLLLVGVVCLRQQIGPMHAPPAFVPADAQPGGDARQPTILTADPSSELGPPATGPWREPDGLPVRGLDGSPGPSYPINPDAHGDRFPIPVDPVRPPVSVPLSDERPRDWPPGGPAPGEAWLSGEIGGGAAAIGGERLEPSAAPYGPATVTTVLNDSLWWISERVYGSGLHYLALFACNRERIARPDRIVAGVELLTPPVEELRRQYPQFYATAATVPGSHPR